MDMENLGTELLNRSEACEFLCCVGRSGSSCFVMWTDD